MAKSSKGDASDKDILDVILAWFMHCNFQAAETGLMSHYLSDQFNKRHEAVIFRVSKQSKDRDW